MGLLSAISGILKPASDIVDKLITNDEERGLVKAELDKISNALLGQVLTYEQTLLQTQANVIKAEANGQSWLQRSWRPITMLTFLVLIVCDSFGILQFRLSDKAWDLLQLGMGGYVVGRSAEKVLPQIANIIKK